MKLNSPIPQPLTKECTKAARIFKSFVDGGNNGLDGVVPRSVLENAKGFAIFTIFKAGFLFSARAGSGIVIARLDDGRWSSPSAIGTAGVGVGGQAGAEMTDFLIVLNTRSAIQTFMAAGSLTLGGNMSIALGPLGRNGEAIGSLNTSGMVAAMYSYSKTRGLFGGISVEGSVIVERQDANHQAYHSPVTARMLLGGVVDPPEWASFLIRTLESCTTGIPAGMKWVQDEQVNGVYAFSGGLNSPGVEHAPSHSTWKKQKNNFIRQQTDPPPSRVRGSKNSGAYLNSTVEATQLEHSRHCVTDWCHDMPTGVSSSSSPPVEPNDHLMRPPLNQRISYSSVTPLDMSYDNPAPPGSHRVSASYPSPFSKTREHPSSGNSHNDATLSSFNNQPKPQGELQCAIALYDFDALENGDLSFSKGDVIEILQMSDSSDDWWTGKCGRSQGIFPANRVEII